MAPTTKLEENPRYSMNDAAALPPAVGGSKPRPDRERNSDAAGPSSHALAKQRGRHISEGTLDDSPTFGPNKAQESGLDGTHSSRRRPGIITDMSVSPASAHFRPRNILDEIELEENKIDSVHNQSQSSIQNSVQSSETERHPRAISQGTHDQEIWSSSLQLFPDTPTLSSQAPAPWLSSPATSPLVPLNTISTPQARAFYTVPPRSTTSPPTSSDQVHKNGATGAAQSGRDASLGTPSSSWAPASSCRSPSDLDDSTDTSRQTSILRQVTPWPETDARRSSRSLRRVHAPVDRTPHRALDRRHECTTSSPLTQDTPTTRPAAPFRLDAPHRANKPLDRPCPALYLRPSHTALPRPDYPPFPSLSSSSSTAPRSRSRSRASYPPLPIPPPANPPLALLLDRISARALDQQSAIEALQLQSRRLADQSPRANRLARSNAVHGRPRTFHPRFREREGRRDKDGDVGRGGRGVGRAVGDGGDIELGAIERPGAPAPALTPTPAPRHSVPKYAGERETSSSEEEQGTSSGGASRRTSRGSRFWEHLDAEDGVVVQGVRSVSETGAGAGGGVNVGDIGSGSRSRNVVRVPDAEADRESSIVVHGCGVRRVLSRLCEGMRKKKRKSKGKKRRGGGR